MDRTGDVGGRGAVSRGRRRRTVGKCSGSSPPQGECGPPHHRRGALWRIPGATAPVTIRTRNRWSARLRVRAQLSASHSVAGTAFSGDRARVRSGLRVRLVRWWGQSEFDVGPGIVWSATRKERRVQESRFLSASRLTLGGLAGSSPNVTRREEEWPTTKRLPTPFRWSSGQRPPSAKQWHAGCVSVGCPVSAEPWRWVSCSWVPHRHLGSMYGVYSRIRPRNRAIPAPLWRPGPRLRDGGQCGEQTSPAAKHSLGGRPAFGARARSRHDPIRSAPQRARPWLPSDPHEHSARLPTRVVPDPRCGTGPPGRAPCRESGRPAFGTILFLAPARAREVIAPRSKPR